MRYLFGRVILLSAFAVSASAQQPSLGDRLPEAQLPQPAPVWFTFDDYPRDAVLQRMEGAVQYRVTIGADGYVRDCAILQSSGHNLLDQQTCAILRRRAKFQPPRDQTGQQLASEYIGTTRWLLPPGPIKPPEPFRTVHIELQGEKPICSVDWDGQPRMIKSRVCRDFVVHLSKATTFPVNFEVSATPHEFGFDD